MKRIPRLRAVENSPEPQRRTDSMPLTFTNASCALSGSPHLANERKKNDYVSRNGIRTEAAAESGSHSLCIARAANVFMPILTTLSEPRDSRINSKDQTQSCCHDSFSLFHVPRGVKQLELHGEHERPSESTSDPGRCFSSAGPGFFASRSGIAMNERKRNEVKWSPLASTKKCDSFAGARDRTGRTRAAGRRSSTNLLFWLANF